MEYKQFSAKTVEDAVINASIAFGTSSDHIEYEVIEKGSTGLLGLFGKPAVIRAKVKETEGDPTNDTFIPETLHESPNADKKEKTGKKSTETVKTEETFHESKPAKTETSEKEESKSEAASHKSDEVEPVSDEYVTFLTDIFRIMNMEVKIESKFDQTNNVLDINLAGDDMGILIGKRGQTLDSLQYLVSLLVNKKREHYVRVKLDTENYRERRKETLETLAKNIANKVKRTKRPVSLEPMNPYERRVIHAVLQNDKYVLTRSEGEEPYRHVVVFLKRERYHKS